ncbi:hypothetical protein SUGI_0223350 [Cryptomeria japonica]|nr:hypothetical protein SUGI_0223350 [Cryptomeria japonica]
MVNPTAKPSHQPKFVFPTNKNPSWLVCVGVLCTSFNFTISKRLTKFIHNNTDEAQNQEEEDSSSNQIQSVLAGSRQFGLDSLGSASLRSKVSCPSGGEFIV